MRKHYFDLVQYRSYVDLKSESAQSYLGMLWWVLDPLFYLGMFYLVFGVILERGGEGFVGFLLCGLVFWRWFANSVQKASRSIQNNSSIITQVCLPKLIFPIVDIVSNTYRFLFILLIFVAFLIIYRGVIDAVWLSACVVFTAQLVLILGVGMSLSLIIPLFPDIKKLIDNVLTLLFYLSGIFFDINELSASLKEYLLLNPMAVLIEQYRRIFLSDEVVNLGELSYVYAVGIILLLMSILWGMRFDKQYPRIMK